MMWTEILAPALSFAGGAGGAELIRSWRGGRRDDAENRRDEAMADSAIADAAVKLLEPYRQEVEELRREVGGLKTEMQADRREQTRVVGLLQQAISVIRDCVSVLRERDIPAPAMSPELLAEIDRTV